MGTTLHLPDAVPARLFNHYSLVPASPKGIHATFCKTVHSQQPDACKGTASRQATHTPGALPPLHLQTAQTLTLHCRIRSLSLDDRSSAPHGPRKIQESEPMRLRVH